MDYHLKSNDSSKAESHVIVYSAESGTVAEDGIFTPTLLKYLETPGKSFTEILRDVRREVYTLTNGAQTPGAYDQLFDPIYLASYKPVPKVPEGFVLVEAGTFRMGSNDGDYNDRPVHTVRIIRDFYIAKYEVTQKLWNEVIGNNPSYYKGDDLPVERVSWYDAVEFCNRLSRREGLTPAYSISGKHVVWNRAANGYRLPTEAEWEYAARGGNKSRGYNFAGSNDVDEVGWYGDNSGDKTHPVGQKRPNELSIYDMSGNVSEWCWDWYDKDYYSSSPSSDPVACQVKLPNHARLNFLWLPKPEA